MLQTINDWVDFNIRKKGDISEHLLTLKRYAEECEHVTELGVRWVSSTWGLLAGKPKKMKSFDISPLPLDMEQEIQRLAAEQGTEWVFIRENVLNTSQIDATDLLFIDTLHSYKQLRTELDYHAHKAKKYIILHDTATFGHRNEGDINENGLDDLTKTYLRQLRNKQGLLPALADFLDLSKEWKIKEVFLNNNGLTVLERV